MSEDRKDKLNTASAAPYSVETDETNRFWAASQAVLPLLAPRIAVTFLHGATGGTLRPGAFPLHYSDVTHWLVPGLAACGITAECVELPADETAMRAWLVPVLQRGHTLSLLKFAPSEPSLAASDSSSHFHAPNRPGLHNIREIPENEGHDAELSIPSDLRLLHQSLLIGLDAHSECAILHDATGQERSIPFAAVRQMFSHALSYHKMPNSTSRRQQIPPLLRRWMVFADAHSDRFAASEQSIPRLGVFAEFLQEVAGKGRSPIPVRLRRAASLLQTGQTDDPIREALNLLREVVCHQLALPIPVQDALLAPPDEMLTEAECRELIYLARAGTRDVKILALHRLQWERQRPDVRYTLDAMRYDTDAWVRTACAAL